jgi:hypothetical protein
VASRFAAPGLVPYGEEELTRLEEELLPAMAALLDRVGEIDRRLEGSQPETGEPEAGQPVAPQQPERAGCGVGVSGRQERAWS